LQTGCQSIFAAQTPEVGVTLMVIEPALRSDNPAVVALLAGANLPVADLADASVEFWVARRADAIVGSIGLERYGNAGLLRSLVVEEAYRGSGVGVALVRTLEEAARAAGIDRLVLLTETAQAFFARHGYETGMRDAAAEGIRQSSEFRALCPASATCMIKSLVATTVP
jgi:amino-acid N-acetyltransferase